MVITLVNRGCSPLDITAGVARLPQKADRGPGPPRTLPGQTPHSIRTASARADAVRGETKPGTPSP